MPNTKLERPNYSYYSRQIITCLMKITMIVMALGWVQTKKQHLLVWSILETHLCNQELATVVKPLQMKSLLRAMHCLWWIQQYELNKLTLHTLKQSDFDTQCWAKFKVNLVLLNRSLDIATVLYSNLCLKQHNYKFTNHLYRLPQTLPTAPFPYLPASVLQ